MFVEESPSVEEDIIKIHSTRFETTFAVHFEQHTHFRLPGGGIVAGVIGIVGNLSKYINYSLPMKFDLKRRWAYMFYRRGSALLKYHESNFCYRLNHRW